MFVYLYFILNAALFLAPVQSWAGNLDDGRLKVETACMTCHGLDGQATLAMTANLSGQQKEYLIAQLQAFRSGKRQHEQMRIIAEMLTDNDIENVSEWYSSIAVVIELPIK
jgi:cytochrome c553